MTQVLALGFLLILATPANTESICLTAKQARELFPRIHLYWYRDKQTGNHCWSNQRRGPPRGLKINPENIKGDPVTNSSAQATTPWVDESEPQKSTPKTGKIKREPPEKVATAPLDSREPLKIEKDFCCWPDLQQLEREVAKMHYERLKGWLEYKP